MQQFKNNYPKFKRIWKNINKHIKQLNNNFK
jgi:hypothetical protein